jgi:ABC-type proline/glycine betaine transport system permease subunit
MAIDLITATLLAIAAGIVRCVAGWLENALRDGEIQSFEWKQLAGTLAVFIGTVNVLSLGLKPETATIVAFALDMIRTALKKYSEMENEGG